MELYRFNLPAAVEKFDEKKVVIFMIAEQQIKWVHCCGEYVFL